eukprot:gene1887-2568_t
MAGGAPDPSSKGNSDSDDSDDSQFSGGVVWFSMVIICSITLFAVGIALFVEAVKYVRRYGVLGGLGKISREEEEELHRLYSEQWAQTASELAQDLTQQPPNVPLGVLQEEQKLSFDPKLSKEKMEAVGSLEMGPMIKLTMKFATRFWERGTYCWGMMADERGEWPEYFVTSMEGHTDENIMFAYIAGKYSLALIDTPDSNVQAAALRKLRVIFPGGVDNPVASVARCMYVKPGLEPARSAVADID